MNRVRAMYAVESTDRPIPATAWVKRHRIRVYCLVEDGLRFLIESQSIYNRLMNDVIAPEINEPIASRRSIKIYEIFCTSSSLPHMEY